MKKLLIPVIISLLPLLTACGQMKAYPTPKPGERLALIGATLLDGRGILFPKGNLIFVDGKIVSVEEYRESNPPTADILVDVSGRWIMPGLINAHVHLKTPEDLKVFAGAGVTTVRDLAARSRDWLRMSELSLQDQSYARLVCASPILTGEGGYGTPSFKTPEEAAASVNEWADAGADLIKFSLERSLNQKLWKVPSMEMINALGREAERRSIKLSVHLTRDQFIPQALEAGVDDIAHMAVDRVSEGNIAALVNAGVVWIPTLELWSLVSKRAGQSWIRIPMENLSRFRNAGGRVSLGTDYNGWEGDFDLGMPMTEMKLLVQSGMSMTDVIKSGTSEAAFVCGLDKEIGSLAPGFLADLIILEENPLDGPEKMKFVQGVYHGGVSLK